MSLLHVIFPKLCDTPKAYVPWRQTQVVPCSVARTGAGSIATCIIHCRKIWSGVCVCRRYTDEEEVVTLYPQSAQTCMYIHIPGNSRLDDVGRVLGLMYTEWELLRKRLVGWLVTQTQ